MNILTFTLQQHTPMLHFQASQQGATLRASDVKPRFDRWLIEKVWGNEFDKCCSYLVGYSKSFSKKQKDDFREKFKGGYRALNYKMRIQASEPVAMPIDVFEKFDSKDGIKKYETVKYPGRYILVLSNMGGKKKEEDLHNLIKYGKVEVSICCPDDDLAEHIKKNYPTYIHQISFGSRARKGFGHFSVSEINGQKYEQVPASCVFKMMSLELLVNNKNRTELNYPDVYKDLFSCIFLIDKQLKELQKDSLKKGEKQLLGLETKWKAGVPKHLPSPIFFLPIVKPVYDKKGTIFKFEVNLFYRLDMKEIVQIPFVLPDNDVCAQYHSLMKKVAVNFRPVGCTYLIRTKGY